MKRSGWVCGIGRTVALVTVAVLLCAPPGRAQDVFVWQGAGTGGTTGSDPNDPNTQWSVGANWQGGTVPTGGSVCLTLTNDGYCYAASANIYSLHLFTQGSDAGLVIGEDVSLLGAGFLQLGCQLPLIPDPCAARLIQTAGSFRATDGQLGFSGGTAAYVQSGGRATFDRDLLLGYEPGSTGTYALSDGTLSATSGTIGYQGVGIFDQSGGSASFADQLILSHEPEGTGRYTLSGGELVAGRGTIAHEGYGRAEQTDGRAAFLDSLVLGGGTNGWGLYYLYGGTLTMGSSDSVIGASGYGRLRQYGGSVAADGLVIGQSAGGRGRYYLLNGTLIGSGHCRVGVDGQGLLSVEAGYAELDDLTVGLAAGEGTVYQTGGSLRTRDAAIVGAFGYGRFIQDHGTHTIGRTLFLGESSGGHGTYELGNGALVLSKGGGPYALEIVGRSGRGYFLQTNGSHAINGSLVLGVMPGSEGTYDLRGGSLWAGAETISYGGRGSFHQSGGTNETTYLSIGPQGTYALSGGQLAVDVQTGILPGGQFLQTDGTHTADEVEMAGYYELAGGSLAAGVVAVHSEFNQSGGSADIAEELRLGYGPGSMGTYRLSGWGHHGSGFLSVQKATIGRAGHGVFIQSGGSAGFGSDLILGYAPGSTGGYELSLSPPFYNSKVVAPGGTIGYQGLGQFVQSGGSVGFDGSLVLGYEPGGTGTYDLHDPSGGGPSSKSLVAGSGTIGHRGFGEFHVSGYETSAWFEDTLLLGDAVGGMGTCVVSGGELLTYSGTVGHEGRGEFSQTGGEAAFWNSLVLGGHPGSEGLYQLAGGLLFCPVGTLVVGDEGYGQFLQTGGSGRLASLVLGQSAGGLGIGELHAGELTAGFCRMGGSGEGLFTQDSGQAKFGWVAVGGEAGGSYHLRGGSLHSTSVAVSGLDGLFHHEAGSVATDMLHVASFSGSGGTYLLESGRLQVIGSSSSPFVDPCHLGTIIGGGGGGCFIQTGGQHTLIGPPYVPFPGPVPIERHLTLGLEAGDDGAYYLLGGSLSAPKERIGLAGRGYLRQEGGVNWVRDELSIGPLGTYELSGGVLRSDSTTIDPNGQFLQTGGLHSADVVLAEGHYAALGGSLGANVLEIRGGEFTLGRWADVSLRTLVFRQSWPVGPTFHAEPWSRIHMTGPGAEVQNRATDPTTMGGLSNLRLIFDGPGDERGGIEVAGKDLGPTQAGYEDNFALGALEVGSPVTGGVLHLRDSYDSQPGWSGAEALYVDTLILHRRAVVDPHGLSLYYCNESAAVKRFFVADANLDGAVNAGDLALMSGNWLRSDGLAGRMDGDLNGDGMVDGGDLALLGTDWGKQTEVLDGLAYSMPPGDQPLPEPTALLILTAGTAVLIRRRR